MLLFQEFWIIVDVADDLNVSQLVTKGFLIFQQGTPDAIGSDCLPLTIPIDNLAVGGFIIFRIEEHIPLINLPSVLVREAGELAEGITFNGDFPPVINAFPVRVKSVNLWQLFFSVVNKTAISPCVRMNALTSKLDFSHNHSSFLSFNSSGNPFSASISCLRFSTAMSSLLP